MPTISEKILSEKSGKVATGGHGKDKNEFTYNEKGYTNPPENIIIEKLRFRDVPRVIRMYQESSNELKQRFRNPRVLTSKRGHIHLHLSTTPLKHFLIWQIDTLIAKKVDEIVGCAYILKKRYKKRDKKILGIMVKDGYQSQGIGNRLMDEILKNQNDVCLTVLNSNKRAIRLYEKHGFETESIDRFMRLKKKKCKK